jgi:hypothetical protein
MHGERGVRLKENEEEDDDSYPRGDLSVPVRAGTGTGIGPE